MLDGSVVLAHVKDDGTILTQVVNSNQQFEAATGQLTPLAGNDIASSKSQDPRCALPWAVARPPSRMIRTIHFVSDNKGKRKRPNSPAACAISFFFNVRNQSSLVLLWFFVYLIARERERHSNACQS